jgi:hypothetical protein
MSDSVNSFENIQSNVDVLKIKSFQDAESVEESTFCSLKKELDNYRELEMGIWYHLISPLDDKQKILEIFEAMKSNMSKRCIDFGKELGI